MAPKTEKRASGDLSLPGSPGGLAEKVQNDNAQTAKRNAMKGIEVRVVLIYVAVAALWILISDPLLGLLVSDPQLRVEISVLKGWAFIAVTALLLLVVLRRETRHWFEERKARNEAEATQRQQNERQQILLEASRLASETSGAEHELSVALMKILGPHLQADFCFHYRLEDDGQYLELIAAIGLPPEYSARVRRLSLDGTFAGSVAKSMRPMIVDKKQLATDARGAFSVLLGVKAYAACPLVTRDGQVLGTLSFGSRQRESFSSEEVEMIEIVSRFVSLATERLRSMAALRESEARYRLLAENTADVIWVADVETHRFKYMSPSIERLSGFTPEEALTRTTEDLLTPGSYAQTQQGREERFKALESGDCDAVTQSHEVEMRCKDGSTVWTEAVTTLLRGSDNRLQLLGVSRDITARRKMEKTLHAQEVLLRETSELAHIGGWEFDPATLVGSWTEEAARIHDLDAGAKINVSKGIDYYVGASRDKIAVAVREAIEQGKSYDLELEIQTAKGRRKWVRTNGHPVTENGRVVRIHGAIQDITPRRRAAEFSDGQKQVLEMIASGQPLKATLGALVRLTENHSDGMLCSVMLVDEVGAHLFDGSSPSLPAEYTAAINGMPIGRSAGSCGTAAFRKEAVFAEDIGVDPLWDKFRHLALPHGLRACLSTPILGDKKQLLGTFAVYFKTPRKPEPEHLHLIELSTHTAAIAIGRHRVETALQRSEEQSRAVVESAPDAIFIQARGRFAYLNPAAVRLFGAQTAGQLIGCSVIEQFHPADRARVIERIKRLNAQRHAVPTMEERILRCDGTVADVEVSAVPFIHEGENGALVFARDVSVRKRNEERLLFQQAIMQETGQIAKVGGWSFDALTGEGFWTDEVARIHELPTDAPTELKLGLQFYQGASREKIEEAIKLAVEQGQPYDLELELVTAKGNRKWVRTIGHPLMENGKVIRVRGSFQDITERKLAVQALQESEARFRQVVENIEEAFWVTDPEKSVILYISPAYEKIWGRSAASVIESPGSWIEAIHPEDRERVQHAAMTKQASGDYAETYRIKRPDGSTRWVLDRAFPVRDADGRVYRIVGTATDITEHRKLENQFRQAQKMEAIGTLAGGIAHDFNNILGAISGYAELAKMDPCQEVTATSLEEILKASRRAGELVRQILAFSRQQEQKRLPLQLWRIVDEAIRLLRAALPSTIKFEIDLAKEAPMVLADATQIHQVVMNLCANAAHAMAGRSGLLQVKLEPFEMDEDFARAHHGTKPGLYARLEIRDNGHGMDQATIDRIFEPFFTTKAPGEGTGLGLSVVHGIVQNHEGVITVYSRPGAGTAFHLYFPAHLQEATVPIATEGALPRGNGERILIVDDEAQLVRMTSAMLGKLGYEVETSTQPVLALQKATAPQASYDLVVTDLTMPEMTGTEFATHVLLASPKTRIVLMTGFMTKQNQEQVANLGVREILFKPVSLRALAETIHRVLKS